MPAITHQKVLVLDQLTLVEQSTTGNKAYNCARLKQAGFAVPDGLVVLSIASDADLARIAEHEWFEGLPAATVFAVRSSGIGEDSVGESFAGIHETSLNVSRADLAAAIARCRASARSPQATEYRRARGLPPDATAMGVLIQRMVEPVAAGVAFTINPVTGAADELVINSSWGLGDALVSGQVDPDEFVVRKPDAELGWRRIGEKGNSTGPPAPSLTEDQVRELAATLIAIEQHYGSPQDVEWCHDGSQFWIVQARPVTTARTRIDDTEWTRANLAEVLPDLTSPQALSVFEEMLNQAERRYMGTLLAPALGPMVKSFHGRLYFNLSQLRWISALAGMAPAVMLKSMGHADAIHPSDEVPPRAPIVERLLAVPDLLRMLWQHLRVDRLVREHTSRNRALLTRSAAIDPRRMPDEELWSVIDEWIRESPDRMQVVLVLGGVAFHETRLRKVCDKVGFAFERLVYPQLAIGERSVSAEQAFDFVALAEVARREPAVARYLIDTADFAGLRSDLRGTAFLAAFERFLERYGHRGRYETDWSLPRYSEDPGPLLQALRSHLRAGATRSNADTTLAQQRESAEAWSAFIARLSAWQRWTILPRVRRSIRTIKRYYVSRERVRSDMVRVLAAVRIWHLVLAERFVERGWLDRRDDYFLLRLEEIGAVITGRSQPERLRELSKIRLAARARQQLIAMPLLMRESDLPRLVRMAGVSGRSTDERVLSGHPVSTGSVEAEVVVVRDPHDFSKMRAGAILVAPATDPAWTPLFTLASGVIVEVGGVLSHASTIAREFGLPALANVKHATKRLRTGERVRLDANEGVIYRLQR